MNRQSRRDSTKAWHTKYLWRNDKRRCGRICIRGTRLAITDILRESLWGDGKSCFERVKRAWPHVRKQQVDAALELIFELLTQADRIPRPEKGEKS